ncbi:MAG: tRNA threonylcarbamoyladenosine dehydratase [Kiritimatiellae bacterium]|nr:tRNA threonylcarbamoyladenosine dehydratase [Kiritimatiellia bacterium]
MEIDGAIPSEQTEAFSRTERLLGSAAMARLARARVAVFGVGGVGGYAVEALARSGVGAFELVDPDRVCLSNLNRQILATRATIGAYKVDVAAERIRSINPAAEVAGHRLFFLPESESPFDFARCDYVIDAVDTVGAKIEIVLRARTAGVPVISSMGAGNKLDPCGFVCTDLTKTSVCPLARVMRKELGKRGIRHLDVVWSRESPVKPCEVAGGETVRPGSGRPVPGSVAFVPSVAGLILAGEVVRRLAGNAE